MASERKAPSASLLGHILFYGYLVAILVGGFVVGHVVLQMRSVLQETHRAQCVAKADAQKQVRQTKQFIREHPNGTADFSKQFLLSSLHQAELRAKTLSDVSC